MENYEKLPKNGRFGGETQFFLYIFKSTNQLKMSSILGMLHYVSYFLKSLGNTKSQSSSISLYNRMFTDLGVLFRIKPG